MKHQAGVNITDITLKGEVTRLDTSTSGQIVIQGAGTDRSTVVLTMPSATIQETKLPHPLRMTSFGRM